MGIFPSRWRCPHARRNLLGNRKKVFPAMAGKTRATLKCHAPGPARSPRRRGQHARMRPEPMVRTGSPACLASSPMRGPGSREQRSRPGSMCSLTPRIARDSRGLAYLPGPTGAGSSSPSLPPSGVGQRWQARSTMPRRCLASRLVGWGLKGTASTGLAVPFRTAGTPLPGSTAPAVVVHEAAAGDVGGEHQDTRVRRTWRVVEMPIGGHLAGEVVLRSEWYRGVATVYGIRCQRRERYIRRRWNQIARGALCHEVSDTAGLAAGLHRVRGVYNQRTINRHLVPCCEPIIDHVDAHRVTRSCGSRLIYHGGIASASRTAGAILLPERAPAATTDFISRPGLYEPACAARHRY